MLVAEPHARRERGMCACASCDFFAEGNDGGNDGDGDGDGNNDGLMSSLGLDFLPSAAGGALPVPRRTAARRATPNPAPAAVYALVPLGAFLGILGTYVTLT